MYVGHKNTNLQNVPPTFCKFMSGHIFDKFSSPPSTCRPLSRRRAARRRRTPPPPPLPLRLCRTLPLPSAATSQCQQMQNQQNMMAMIMMSMMGRNASGSVPNDGVVNMFSGISSTEQRNDGEGSNSNTQE
jgi:hypothetical protein